jgi:deferrochelatase/peroxidase EfeB
MNLRKDSKPTRRNFLAAGAASAAGGLLAAAGANQAARAAGDAASTALTEPFFGPHQAGILTPMQSHTYFAAFDLIAAGRDDLIDLFRQWTISSARMTAGRPVADLDDGAAGPPNDTGEALELPAARLTLTFGFGAGLFTKDGHDRFGLSSRRPDALVDLPAFRGERLVSALTGGDLSVQACADDEQVAFHAVRQLARQAAGIAELRWARTGFVPNFAPGQTPRNLLGFKDGTSNPSAVDPEAMEKFVWSGGDGPDWMRGGSYVVVRRIRMALERWDHASLDLQERTFGRHKYSGAPLGGRSEFDPPDLAASAANGNSVIPDYAHIRLAAAASNDGVRILRRAYSYNDGLDFTAAGGLVHEQRQGPDYDAGLLFVCYQRDPRTGFIRMFERMSKLDMLNEFVTHTGGGLFACPGGVAEGEFIGQELFA